MFDLFVAYLSYKTDCYMLSTFLHLPLVMVISVSFVGKSSPFIPDSGGRLLHFLVTVLHISLVAVVAMNFAGSSWLSVSPSRDIHTLSFSVTKLWV